MKLEQLIKLVREQMPEKRWQHTVGVMASAVQLADRYGADRSEAELAALLHDYCKYWPIERQREAVEAGGVLTEVLEYDKPLWHAPAAAAVAANDLRITNTAVIDAIRYHTTGREKMTLLDKIICLADYIEPGRDFPDVNGIRNLAEHSLEQALIAGFDSTIQHLLKQGQQIFPLMISARNCLIDELKGRLH
ncbi:bis(5'-nucleosyl)-tetraphosphatase (symmetrical) YqeK [Paenibacillus senegalensis]|uniref:bis(5'-nucleosyl)-tetraphosphatase (symmetrical) YqeK n=1 Tax=Paenibacillus senegalensis TaxID=1465766 RepID=UPI0002893BE4|nr:bis(5'-nucleosyl)-tetraphosphatase (symmetrical) YqeK [Paenibacillus senegalensis]